MFDWVVLIVTVARALRCALRVVVFVLREFVFGVDWRLFTVGFAERDVFVAVLVSRLVVAVREIMFFDAVRALALFWGVVCALREMVDLAVCRDGELASRTAASTVPTPIKSAVMRYITFLILL